MRVMPLISKSALQGGTGNRLDKDRMGAMLQGSGYANEFSNRTNRGDNVGNCFYTYTFLRGCAKFLVFVQVL